MTGGQLVRKWVFKTSADWDQLYAFMGLNLKPMAEQGRFLQCVVSEYKASRSAESNAYMWVGLLKPISEQAWVGGRTYSDEVWHEQFKREYLPETNARGMDKWEYLPNGDRSLVMGTQHLNKDEMTLYLNQVAEYATTVLGVHLPVNPNDPQYQGLTR